MDITKELEGILNKKDYMKIERVGNQLQFQTNLKSDDDILILLSDWVGTNVNRMKTKEEKIGFCCALVQMAKNAAEIETEDNDAIMVFYKTVNAIMAGMFDE